MKQTPMLQQYLELKSRHRDSLMLYRLGDFYELFFEDAETAAPILGLVLTRRRQNDQVTSPMCGIPHHALAAYVGKLLEAGFKVAIAEQMEDPAQAGGLVRREVVRILSPGTVTDPELLGDGERRWVVALSADAGATALAFLEVASGTFGGALCAGPDELRELAAQLRPREALVAEGEDFDALWPADVERPLLSVRPAAWFGPARAEEILRRCLGVGSLRAFELEPGEALVGAAGALLEYLAETQGETARHLGAFERRHRAAELVLDAATVRNLEILRDASGERRASLARVLDHTVTPMGARLLREWLLRPLVDSASASLRHEAVAWLIEETATLASLRERLAGVGDLERVAARLGLKQLRPGELAGLRAGLARLPELQAELASSPCQLLAALAAQVDPLEDLKSDLDATLSDEVPALLGPGTIRPGRDPVLDEARRLSRDGKEVLGELEARERAATGISNLRIRYNRVFGYAFEVSRSNLDRVPDGWTRKQTLTGAERFVTAELVDLERRILGAEGEADEREKSLFAELLDRGAGHAGVLAATARAIAAADVLAGFADRARRRSYCRPQLLAGHRVRLVASRHPVVEDLSGQPFVPNDVELDGEGRQIVLLTGPNMGGKSTYLRQVALAVIMARAGSFVAAEAAEIGDVDRVFTRVGAADDLARGESTFMVEMTEVARILRQATPRSLVILDEVGRGTATFDGLSLAWAVVEALHDPPMCDGGPLVIFATHYHELTDLADRLDRVVNASVAVKEWQGHVLFLHRVVPGPSDRSYGIHVARLAGVPDAACKRAQVILKQLERQELKVVEATAPGRVHRQLSLFPAGEEIVAQRLRKLQVESLTPLDALNLLAELKREVEE
ncbi:MAG: DNA mismatch repair protein MutS [Thermoanaerobaculaceae bacterium]|jgi:DNA mismatch repair protein MutS|nr:DNA mismatch repair protein MutS [Thermoanaerobaculaceae bacterium]